MPGGLSPNEAARSLLEDDDIEVSGRNVQRWVDKYPKMIEAFSRLLKIQGGDVVSVDEKHFKSNGKSMWFFNTMCSPTRFILSTDTADDKLNYNADGLFADMLKRLSRHPRMILSDCLRGFGNAFKKILATNPVPESIHINNLALKGKHIDNNMHERQSGSLAERLNGGTHGFGSDHPGLFSMYVVYYNFLRSHMGIGGITPAEKAGIIISGKDKLRTLIRCAAASLVFA